MKSCHVLYLYYFNLIIAICYLCFFIYYNGQFYIFYLKHSVIIFFIGIVYVILVLDQFNIKPFVTTIPLIQYQLWERPVKKKTSKNSCDGLHAHTMDHLCCLAPFTIRRLSDQKFLIVPLLSDILYLHTRLWIVCIYRQNVGQLEHEDEILDRLPIKM